MLLAFGAAVFTAGGLIVALLSRRAVQPIRALARASRQATGGEEIVPLRTGIRETSELSQALAVMSRGLRERERERAEVEAELRRSEANLRDLAGTLEERVAARSAELQQAQDQVRQLQKIESLGRLTGGIAHDFNNMLAIVTGNIDLAQHRIETAPERAAAYLVNAKEGARRASELTAQLLAFSRQQPLAAEPLDVNKLVTGMADLLRRTLGETIRIETELSAGDVLVFADRVQLENAILNLCVNARDAMPDGGRLVIATLGGLPESLPSAAEEVEPDRLEDHVTIRVTDEGIGMDADTVARAFEPFFTTKGVGHGTGLGLSQVHGFARQSGGSAKVTSEVHRGTSVDLILPRFAGTIGSGAADGNADLWAGRPEEVILVVEDEDRVRHMSVDALRELGYTVVSARDAAEALEQLAIQPQVSLLFTDMVMPNMSGARLAELAREARPDLPVLYTTGYTEEAIPRGHDDDEQTHLLMKPFSLVALSHAVRRVLDRSQAGDQPERRSAVRPPVA